MEHHLGCATPYRSRPPKRVSQEPMVKLVRTGHTRGVGAKTRTTMAWGYQHLKDVAANPRVTVRMLFKDSTPLASRDLHSVKGQPDHAM